MYKTTLQVCLGVGFVLLTSFAQAQVGNVTGDLGTTCSATGVGGAAAKTMADDGQCTFTPSVYKISILKWGYALRTLLAQRRPALLLIGPTA